MKKTYEILEIDMMILSEDLITTSANDNVEDMPEFPEFLR